MVVVVVVVVVVLLRLLVAVLFVAICRGHVNGVRVGLSSLFPGRWGGRVCMSQGPLSLSLPLRG